MGPPPNPEAVAEALSDPVMRQQMNEMLRNPAMLDMIIESNPSLRAMGPGARELMQSDMFRQMVTDPQLIRQFGSSGFGGAPQAPAFPAPGNLDDNSTGDAQQQQQPAGANANPGAAANPFAALFGGGAPAALGQNPPQNAEQLSEMLRHLPPIPPSFFGGGGSGGAGAGGDAAQFQNFMNMMGAARGGAGGAAPGAPGANPFASLFGGLPSPSAAAAPADNRPPEDRYADQLRQLNEMGFHSFDQNVAALRRSGGDVQGAIEQLLSGN